MADKFRLVKFELDKKGVGQVLKSKEMLDMLEKEAADRSDGDHHVKSFIGFDRAHAIVYPNTKENPG